MKIVYCNCSIYNPGGMERVLLNKVTYLSQVLGWDVTVVTTDQKGREPFYPFPKEVRLIDLGINYWDDSGKSVFRKTVGYLQRKRLHKKRLTDFLIREKADVVVSLYPSESSFIPDIKDGSRKVLELHMCKFFRLQYGRKGLMGLIDKWRMRQDENIVRKFDKFIVLTEEDKGYWGDLPNMEVIPNAAMKMEAGCSDCSAKRVIAVGRLDYQKSFDRLIEAWDVVQKSGRFDDWRLDIFGQGEWKDMLQAMIDERGLQHTCFLNNPTNKIGQEYVNSSLLVMTSHYEGLPMVMIEAMACGLPVVSYDFLCGPKDVINNGKNGLIAKDGDINGIAEAMMRVMGDDVLRKEMGKCAKSIVEAYSEVSVMEKWVSMFKSLEK